MKNDHNMWAYIFFLIHLEETNENDYTHLEDMVAKQVTDDVENHSEDSVGGDEGGLVEGGIQV